MSKLRMDKILLIVWSITVLITVIYFYNRHNLDIQEKKIICSKPLYGRIIKSRDRHRGYQHITVIQEKDTIDYYFHIHYLFKKYNICIDDSIAKPANDKTMVFYKLQNGSYTKLCEYSIGKCDW